MANRPKPDADHAAGTYSKNPKGTLTQAGESAAAQQENRFAEVQRKSREARARMNAASEARAERRESLERDREYVPATRQADALLNGDASGDEQPS